MAWLVLLLLLFYFYSMELLDHAIFCAWLHFSYHLMPKNHLNIATFCFCWRWESNPGHQRSKQPSYPFHHRTSASQSYFLRSTSFSFDYEMKRTELSARWTERNQRSQPTLVPAKQINLMELFSSSFVAEVFFVSSLHWRQWRHRQEKWSRLSTAGIYIYWNMLRRC